MQLRGSKVLVTGADGFIGSHLVQALVTEGCRVRALVFYSSLGSWGWLEALPPEQLGEVEVVAGDVRDGEAVAAAVEGCEFVFHLAALIAIPYSYRAPASYVDTNVTGTLNVLEGARRHGTRRILVTSTSEVYGTARYAPIDERHPFQGQSPYSATKIGADRLAESFWRSFGLPVTIARPFNTYGPRQSARAVIPTVIVQLLAGTREVRLGNTRPTRDLNYVADVCAGFVAIARSERTIGEEINICSGREISIGELAEQLVALIDPGARVLHEPQRERPALSEVDRLLGDNAKLRALTDWQPRFDLEAGLLETVRWFREPGNLARYKAHVYNV